MSPQDTLKTITHGQRMDLWRTQEELKPMKDVIHTWCLHYRLKSYLIICYGLLHYHPYFLMHAVGDILLITGNLQAKVGDETENVMVHFLEGITSKI